VTSGACRAELTSRGVTGWFLRALFADYRPAPFTHCSCGLNPAAFAWATVANGTVQFLQLSC